MQKNISQNRIQEAENSSVKTRQPIQKRSIEKKNRIIKAGFELICEKGYHSTTTADIAKKAGVSTGIVYNYFTDKKDILLQGITQYFSFAQAPVLKILESHSPNTSFDTLLETLIDSFEESHKRFIKSHQELNALATLDPDINLFFENYEKSLVTAYTEMFSKHINPLPHLYEKFHIAYHLVEDYCHEVALHPNPDIDYAAMRAETISCIKHLLELS